MPKHITGIAQAQPVRVNSDHGPGMVIVLSPWGPGNNSSFFADLWRSPGRTGQLGQDAAKSLRWQFTTWSVAQMVKNLPAMWETWVQYLGQERSAGGGQGHPLQYSCLEHSMDRGAWQVTVHAVSKSQTQLSDLTLSLSLTSMFKQPAQPYQCVSAVYWAQVSLFICKNPIQWYSLLHFSHTHALSIRSEQNEPPNHMVWLKAVQRGWQDIWS